MKYEADLRELQKRLLFIAICFIAAFVAFYVYSPKLMDFVVQKGVNAGYHFVYISPAEVLVQQLKIAAIASLVVIVPIAIIEAALFIGPGIESGFWGVVVPAVFACLMFVAGLCFSYFVLVPFVFSSLYNLGVNSKITAQISIESYISLYLTLLVSLGIVFELPLVSLGLGKFGILNSELMKKGRRVAIVLSLLAAAFITPPDVFSQIIVAIPMIALYEFSIILCRLVEKKGDERCDQE